MFDLPEAKRVRRNEVKSPASSRSPSPVDESDFQDAHARLGKLLNLDNFINSNDTAEGAENTQQPDGDAEDEEQEFEFRLFSAPTKPADTTEKTGEATADDKSGKKSTDGTEKSSSGTQKLRIRLHSPTPGSGDSEGRFVKASRGWQYYFSTSSLWGQDELKSEDEAELEEKRKQFEDMAVSGDHVISWAKSQPWPGSHLPWRVTHLKRHQTKMPPKDKDVPVYVIEGALPSKSPKTRKKPGKKRRVILRKRAAAVEASKVADAEKRNRKNRERKLKRRAKARQEKAAAAGVDVSMVDADAASSAEED